MDDDYVAEVLAREARDSSQRYQTDGLGAYMPRRPAGIAPKPNTRFLRHLIKETDSHNTALKRKEEREARDRLRHLRTQPQDDRTSERSPSTRKHHPQSSSSDLTRGQREERRDRPKRGERESQHSQRKHRARDSSAERDRSRRHRHRDESRDRSSRDHRDRRDDRDTERRRKRRSGRDRSHSPSRSQSPRRDRSSERHRKHRHRSESRTDKPSSHSRRTRTERSDGAERDRRQPPQKSHSHSTRTSTDPRDKTQDSPSNGARASTALRRDHSDGDSDPLEDLVGPLPPQKDGEGAVPLRSRGRGAYKPSASNIDAHFAPNYDPTLDVQSDDDRISSVDNSSRRPVAGLMTADDDWDMALEALRDRQRWKQKGEERLRAAGWNEETIDRWKNNPAFTGATSTESNPENVRWAKKGEGREWDRGKVIGEDGHIDVRAAW
ncbi:hypothetical protein PMG11_05857 [Penicillium brasilianum]|uniref:Pre-mRNA-splicing factor 38B n=1 Tax=Penicillium brasilianum TaxID=104259 RepID=A0A0F7TQ91_PENBI|nr:hypothetical protein PMG11_05857 [Penicillium brasilianum]